MYAQIPNGTPFGTGYRIRIVASDPAIIGLDNGSDIIIKTDVAPSIPNVSINGPTDFCYGSATTFWNKRVNLLLFKHLRKHWQVRCRGRCDR